MTPEIQLQHAMFTGELVDSRAAAQKRADGERDLDFNPKSLKELMEWHDQQRRNSI